MRIQRYCEEHFLPKAEARFLERKHQLDRVTYSLVRVRDAFLARELYLQILNGEASFAEVASKHGEGPEKKAFGVIGPRPLAQGHPVLVEKLRSAEPGKVMEPFRIDDWWLVVRLEELHSADFNPQIANQMASELFDDWINEEVTRKLRQQFAQAESNP
nr:MULTISPECIES: peptidylprolyl isomerase [unclassified Synechococcus]